MRSRLIGVLTAPRSTLTTLAAQPRWAGTLLLILAVLLIGISGFLATGTGQLALVDQRVRSVEAFGGEVTDAQYDQWERTSPQAPVLAAVAVVVAGPVLAFGLAGLLHGVFNRGVGPRASYRQVLAIVVHAGVVLAARQVVATPLYFARESLANPTTLGLFFPMLDEASPAARFFGILDLFVIWSLVVLAIGVSVLYRRPAARIALIFIGVYMGVALLMALAMVLSGGTV